MHQNIHLESIFPGPNPPRSPPLPPLKPPRSPPRPRKPPRSKPPLPRSPPKPPTQTHASTNPLSELKSQLLLQHLAPLYLPSGTFLLHFLPVWVLCTDYTRFAMRNSNFHMSCTDIGEDQSQYLTICIISEQLYREFLMFEFHCMEAGNTNIAG